MAKLKSNGSGKNRPTSINTTAAGGSTWSHLDVLNQIMTPVPMINDGSLQQELSFYTTAQMKLNEPSTTTTASTAATPIVTNADPPFFDSLNISNSHHQEYSTDQYLNDRNYASLLFNQQQTSNDGSLLLAHEPGSLKQHQRSLQSLYSGSSTPANSTPTSPVVNFHHNYFEQPLGSYSAQADKFETTSLFASPKAAVASNSKGKNNAQKFRFKDDKQPLDSRILSQHNREQNKLSGLKHPKSKNKTTKKQTLTFEDELDRDAQQEDGDDNNDDDVPVIGDGAQSYSSIGSNSSRTSQPLSRDDKRRRNTAASARFRIKKKMREQALQNTASEMTEKAQRMEQRVHELEREIKWLKALVVEKSEAKIEQLVGERPYTSTDLPATTSFPSSLLNKDYLVMPSNSYKRVQEDGEHEDDDEEEEEGDDHGRGSNNGYYQNHNYRRY